MRARGSQNAPTFVKGYGLYSEAGKCYLPGMVKRAQTFTLLVCLLAAAILVFAPASRWVAVPAATGGNALDLSPEPGVMRVSDSQPNESSATQSDPARAACLAHAATSLILVKSVPLPRSSAIQEEPSQRLFSSSSIDKLDGHLLSS